MDPASLVLAFGLKLAAGALYNHFWSKKRTRVAPIKKPMEALVSAGIGYKAYVATNTALVTSKGVLTLCGVTYVVSAAMIPYVAGFVGVTVALVLYCSEKPFEAASVTSAMEPLLGDAVAGSGLLIA